MMTPRQSHLEELRGVNDNVIIVFNFDGILTGDELKLSLFNVQTTLNVQHVSYIFSL